MGTPEEQAVAQDQATQDPMMQIAQVAAQALQAQDCEAAMAVCEAFLMLIQEAQGAAPVGEPQGEPVFKKGGKIKKRQQGGKAKGDVNVKLVFNKTKTTK